MRSAAISGTDPYTLAAGIDRFVSAVGGRAEQRRDDRLGDQPRLRDARGGMGGRERQPDPVRRRTGIPAATRQALLAHQAPHLRARAVQRDLRRDDVTRCGKYGTVKRVGGTDPATNSVAFAVYRDPACPFGQPCAHVPGSFGWAMRSPGHGYVLLNASRPLDAAAAAALSASGDYGPELLVDECLYPSQVSAQLLPRLRHPAATPRRGRPPRCTTTAG